MMYMPARSIWKGSISFGLVNIPVKLYSATEGKEFAFNQLCSKGHRIQYKRWCPIEDREIPWNEIQKGYEISKDRYVLLEKQDFDSIKTTKTIDIKEFIDLPDLDPILINKSYYVGPDTKTVDKAYSLFFDVLNKTKKIAIGKVVLRDREHLVALRAYQRGIVMHELHYLNEIRPFEDIKAVESGKIKVDEQEISLGKSLVENLASDKFDPTKYSDVYTDQLQDLINAKTQGNTRIVKEVESPPDSGQDLLEVLKASVKKSKSK